MVVAEPIPTANARITSRAVARALFQLCQAWDRKGIIEIMLSHIPKLKRPRERELAGPFVPDRLFGADCDGNARLVLQRARLIRGFPREGVFGAAEVAER